MAMRRLRGLTWDDPRGHGPLRVVHQAFCAAYPAQAFAIDWDVQPLGGFETRSLAELVDRYDLIVADHPHVLEAARHGVLAAIDLADDAYVGLVRQSYELEGECWAAPVDAACHVAAYRPEAMGLQGEGELPLTWDDVESRAAAGLRVGLPLAGVHSLMALLTLIGSQPEHAGKQVLGLTEDDVAGALDRLRRLVRLLPRVCLAWNPLQALEALVEGHVDYVPLTFGYAHYEVRGVRFGPVPRLAAGVPGRGVVGGAGIAVSAQSKVPDVAIAFAKFCSQATTQCDWWPNHGGQPAHRTAWEHLAGRHAFYRETRDAMERAVLRPRTEGFHEVQIALGESIANWLATDAAAPPPNFPSLKQRQCAAAL